jgi:hypothetical protein
MALALALMADTAGTTVKDTSVFLKMLTEIRLEVYEHVFEGARVSLRRQQNGDRTVSEHHTLLLSCRMCYFVGLPQFYEAVISSPNMRTISFPLAAC